MITKKHYTLDKQHPEDRIFRDKEYIDRLQRHIHSVYELLAYDLRINEKGKELLFDYVYNEDREITFEEFLQKIGVDYDELVLDYWKDGVSLV
jgi:hypothetical protein